MSILQVANLHLDSTAATADLDTVWNDTAPTSSVFSVGTNALVNTNNDTYLAYLWTEISGFSRFGSYTGNGSADGPFIWCGFRPRWILFKYIGGTDYISKCFAHEELLRIDIQAANTLSDMLTVDLNAGWPNNNY